MDKRFLLALLLTALVVIGVPRIFPYAPPAEGPPAAVAPDVPSEPGVPAAEPEQTAAPVMRAPVDTATLPVPAPMTTARADTATVTTGTAEYRFTNFGARPIGASMSRFPSLRNDSELERVELSRDGEALLGYRILSVRDTISLDTIPFDLERRTTAAGAPELVYTASTAGVTARFTYTFAPDDYLVHVRGDLSGFAAPAYLVIDFPPGIRSEEADTTDDQRNLAYVVRRHEADVRRLGFGDLRPGERTLVPGPLTWGAAKNKYFLFAVMSTPDGAPFREFQAVGGPRTSKQATNAQGMLVSELTDGSVAFDVYAGPQEWRRLRAIGNDLENANPYGWRFMQGIVQPFATIVMRILLWMRDTTQLPYGWILVLFGITVRIILWPLNQRAMRTSLQIQRLQPELAEVQKKYKDKPEKYREEVMKVYKDHGMSPFSPIAGCLPMLLPMPVLIALFFVFQSTIEFRGVPFLWLPDISLKDPLYIIPVLMGFSMFVLSWIGMRNAPPNPQAKIFAYVLPTVMVVIFLNFASGLNLYYFVQNVAALPQQWLIARERAKSMPVGKATPVRAT